MIRYIAGDIRLNELHTQRVIVPSWEVPLLEAIHSNPLAVAEEKLVNRKVPTAETEFQRLAARYKNTVKDDGSPGLPVVESVYGQFGLGIANLRRAIAEGTVTEVNYPAAGDKVVQLVEDFADLF